MNRFNLILLLAATAFLSLAFACPLQKSDMQKALDTARHFGGGVAISTQEKQETPNHVHTYGAIHLDDAQLAAVDKGLLERIALAKADGHTQALDPAFYDVFTVPYKCPLSPEQKIPAFLIRGDAPWDGSEWDQWNTKGDLKTPFRENGILYTHVRDNVGIVFAAEYVLSLGTPGSNIARGQIYACSNLAPTLPEAVGNGFDHIVLANNPDTYPDGFNYFYCSQFHGVDSQGRDLSHPLLPRGDRCTQPAAGALAMRTKAPIVNYTLSPISPGSVPGLTAGPNDLAIRDVDWRYIRPVK